MAKENRDLRHSDREVRGMRTAEDVLNVIRDIGILRELDDAKVCAVSRT